ncbi:MAG TPA: ABC transporter ATP-binding protein [Patescibacteria group bacterium]|nr:ABC transporter ATP-binding protein [Patescibacteria group bacterium]
MKNIANIIRIARPLYGLVGIIAFLIVFGAVLSLVSPIISKFIVDDIVSHLQNKSGNMNNLIFLIALTFIINLLGIIASSLSDRLGDHFAGQIRRFLTEKFYDKVLTLPQSYFDSEVSGKIINQLSRGIFTIQNFINTGTNFILPTILQTVFTIAVLAYYNLTIGFFTFILFPIYLGLSFYSTRRWGKEEEKKNKIEDKLRGRMQEVVGNIKLVKSFTNEKEEYQFVSGNLEESNKIYARQSTTFHIFDFCRNLSLIVIVTIISIIAFINTFQGILTVGSLVLILQLLNQLSRPLFAMSFILTQIQAAESGSKEYFSVLNLPAIEYYESNHFSQQLLIDLTLQFDHVKFKYETSDQVLNDVSFQLNKKEKVALVGHSGAGKSTIVNLLLKFYNPSDGNIYISGKKYKNLSHTFIRKNIGLVFQESELFSSTIKENVKYGTKATDEEVENALKLANAWDFVEKLPKGVDSEVGERGVRLSGGQKQRIQIARAILKDAPVLILDEATSSLDAKSEKEVQVALEHLMEDKLVLIIAHRFSTIQNVNKIMVINDGIIAESGSPQELAARPGIYHDLLQYQIEGNKKLLANFDIY